MEFHINNHSKAQHRENNFTKLKLKLKTTHLLKTVCTVQVLLYRLKTTNPPDRHSLLLCDLKQETNFVFKIVMIREKNNVTNRIESMKLKMVEEDRR